MIPISFQKHGSARWESRDLLVLVALYALTLTHQKAVCLQGVEWILRPCSEAITTARRLEYEEMKC
jgi:hypothetical protein